MIGCACSPHWIVEAQAPHRHQALDVGLVDLRERAVAVLAVAHAVGENVVGVLAVVLEVVERLRGCSAGERQRDGSRDQQLHGRPPRVRCFAGRRLSSRRARSCEPHVPNDACSRRRARDTLTSVRDPGQGPHIGRGGRRPNSWACSPHQASVRAASNVQPDRRHSAAVRRSSSAKYGRLGSPSTWPAFRRSFKWPISTMPIA